MNHDGKVTRRRTPSQRTPKTDLSSVDFRQRVAGYITHHRLEVSTVGMQILDAAARLQAAIVSAMRSGKRSSLAWSQDSGFRSDGDIRKIYTAEMIANQTDVAVVQVLDPEAFIEYAEAVAALAGGRFEPLSAEDRELAETVGRLGVQSAELSEELLKVSSPKSAGGTAITDEEKKRLLAGFARQKRLIAAGESALRRNKGVTK